MQSETPKRTRLIITWVMVIAAVILIFAEPLLVKQILPDIIAAQQAKFEKLSTSGDAELVLKSKLIKDTPYLVSFFYPFWMGLGVFGSIVVLVIARQYYEGEKWARGLALLCFAIPSVGGAYMFVPWMNFVGFGKGFPGPIIIALLGLVPYFTILLAEKSDSKQKWVNFFVFLILGIQGAHSFCNGHAALRIQWMHPARPTWPTGTWVLWLGPQLLWLGVICLILAILFLGLRKRTGWYLATIGGLTTMIADYWIHIVRGTTTDYILGGTFGLIIFALMMIPGVKNRLYDQPAEA